MNAVHDDTIVKLIDRLCASDDETNGHPRMAEESRPQALAALERVLLDLPALDEHIRHLQKRLGRTFRHQGLLPEEQAEQVVSNGVGELTNEELAVLLLNPIASRDLALRIGEDLPDHWLERMSEVGRQVMRREGITRRPREVDVPSSEETSMGDITRLLRDVAGERGVRDLKPSNVLLEDKERKPDERANDKDFSYRFANLIPRITDFGIARRFTPGNDQTRTELLIGTPRYMSPEQRTRPLSALFAARGNPCQVFSRPHP